MYTIRLAGNPVESYENYFDARIRAERYYLNGNEVEIWADGKVLVKYMHIGGVK